MSPITDFISQDFTPFSPLTKVSEAEDFMLYNNFTHFPIVQDGVYWGAISLEDIQTFDMDSTLADVRYAWNAYYVREEATWIDILETAANNRSQLLPVLDAKNRYVGYLENESVLAFLKEHHFLSEQGQILVVAKAQSEYTLSQVCQIAEGASTHILGVWTHYVDKTRTEITLKMRPGNLSEVIAAFRRYNYEIVSEHDEDSYLEKLRERSDYLDKYLNI